MAFIGKPFGARLTAIALACSVFSCASIASAANVQSGQFITPVSVSDTGEYLVKVNANSQAGSELLNQLKADKVSSLTTDAGKQLWLVSLSFEQAKALQGNDAVDYIEADNYQFFYDPTKKGSEFEAASSSDFVLFDSEQYSATNGEILASLNDSEHTPYGISMVNADKVADSTVANKTICIIDSGLQANHGDFAGLNVTGNHSNYSGFWHIDQVQHGTHVAGTVAAMENGTGVVGVIKNGGVNVYVQKLSNGSPGNHIRLSHQIEAMEVCANQGAEVVSMSFGGPNPSNAVNEVIDRLTERGLLFVAAAGNHGRPVNPRICEGQPTDELRQACLNAHKAPHYPASFHNVMSVANINAQAQKAASSPINPEIEIAAPGTNVLSAAAAPYDIFDLSVDGVTKNVVHIGNTGTEFSEQPVAVAACGADKCLDDGDKYLGKACLYQFDFRNLNLLEIANNCATSGGEMMVMYPPIINMGPIRGSFGTPVSLPIFSIGNNTGRAILANNSTLAFGKFTSHHSFLTGTSMATPHVSAVATKVWSLNPACTNSQIRKVLQHTANDLGEVGRDVAFGYGLVDTLAADNYIKANGCDTPAPVCADAWYFNQAYAKGDEVLLDGVIYKAKWWNKNSAPSVTNSAWDVVRACS